MRTALVTGANRGLGSAVAKELHRREIDVVVTARHLDDAVAAAAEIGPGVRSCALDVTDPDSVKAARESVGPIDILVNNAGVNLDAGSSPLAVDVEVVRRTFEVNVLGSWRVMQAFVPGMVERGWGRVVAVSSATGSFTIGLFGGAPGYSASKAALNGLTTMVAAATEGTGVLVNAVNPGMIRTRMMPSADRTAEQAAVEVVDVATLPDDGPTGCFLRGDRQLPW